MKIDSELEKTENVELSRFDKKRESPPALLKWIGSKRQTAENIVEHLPLDYETYFEPFVGSGAILGTIAPKKAVAGDILGPLIEIWQLVQKDPQLLLLHYADNWNQYKKDSQQTYQKVKDSYNTKPNPHDLLFLSRSCYGGVIRFTKEGKISTPIGVHKPISPKSLKSRIEIWRNRIKGTRFVCADFSETMNLANSGDLVYCDPPYQFSQQILYGSQNFRIPDLWKAIEGCKNRGAKVALSIDGKVKSNSVDLKLHCPQGLFEREILIDRGSSMLRRFQKKGHAMVGETVHDRLLLTW